MQQILITIIVVVAIVLVVYYFLVNNNVIRRSKNIESLELSINTEKNKKSNLYTSLINSIEDYNAHEEGIISDVSNARQLLRNGDMESSMGVINALSESYPDLKSQGNYASLMKEISTVENQITRSIKEYNNSVKSLEAYCEIFPNSLFIKSDRPKYETIKEEVDESLQTVNFSRKES